MMPSRLFGITRFRRLKDDLKKKHIDFADINRNDPADAADADKIEIDITAFHLERKRGLRAPSPESYESGTCWR